MPIAAALHRSRAALAHWGIRELLLLAVFWFALSIPLYLMGWGLASVVSLPLLLLVMLALTYCASALIKPIPQPKAQPKPGFPSSIEVPPLGVFTLSAYSDTRYERTIDWCGTEVQLSLSVEAIESIDSVLLVATSISAASPKVNSDVTHFAARDILPSINEERLASGDLVLSPSQFLSAISLQMITVHSDGTYEFLYDDGELLGGHWIEVHGNLSQGPIEVDTPG